MSKTNAKMDEPSVRHRLTLLQNSIGHEAVTRAVDAFQHDAPHRLSHLRSSLERGDYERLKNEAHTLKGSSLTLGLESIADLCLEIEQLGTVKSQQAIDESIDRLAAQLIPATELLVEVCQQL